MRMPHTCSCLFALVLLAGLHGGKLAGRPLAIPSLPPASEAVQDEAPSAGWLEQAEARCRRILFRLWQQQGGSELPDLRLQEISEYGKPAEYDVQHRRIVIDPRAYELCLDVADGKDDALAFLIAHEFVHAYQHEQLSYVSPGFFVKTNTMKEWAQGQRDRRRNMERQADVWGAVLCHLSGYEVDGLIAPFIERLYERFHLREQDPLYDSKQERMEIARVAQQRVTENVQLFELASFLLVLQEYEAAAHIYQYLNELFQSAEFVNNLALAHMLDVLPQLETPYRHCPYPFTLDLETRLEQALPKRQLGPVERLKQCIEWLSQLDDGNGMYLPMRINRACAYVLLGTLETEMEAHYRKLAQADLQTIKRLDGNTYPGAERDLAQMKHAAHLVSAIMSYPQVCSREDGRTYQPPVGQTRTTFPLDEARGGDRSYDFSTYLSFEQGIRVLGKYLPRSVRWKYEDREQNELVELQLVKSRLDRLPAGMYQVGELIPAAVRARMRASTPSLRGDYFLIDDERGLVYRLDEASVVQSWGQKW